MVFAHLSSELLLWQQERRNPACERQSCALTCWDTKDLVESTAHRSEWVKALKPTRSHIEAAYSAQRKDIEQQTGDMCDATTLFS